MATQRYISTSFWTDKWIRKLDPSERYLYLYLLTNPQTNIAGVYEITIDRIAFDTGYDERTLRPILDRFADAGKAHFFDEEWMILPAWPKHQRYSQRGKVLAGIRAILAGLPEDVYAELKAVGYDLQLETDDQPSPRPKRQKVKKSLRESIIKRDGAVCAFCGSTEELEIDHITPVSMGGTNDPENLRVLCRSCNGKRNAELRWDENGRVMGRDGWTIEGHPEKWVSNGWSTNYSDTDSDTDTDTDLHKKCAIAPLKDSLAAFYEHAFTSKFPMTTWSNIGKERGQIAQLAKKTRALLKEVPFDTETDLAKALLRVFWEKRESDSSEYWSSAPFVPSELSNRWSKLVAMLAESHDERQRIHEAVEAARRSKGGSR